MDINCCNGTELIMLSSETQPAASKPMKDSDLSYLVSCSSSENEAEIADIIPIKIDIKVYKRKRAQNILGSAHPHQSMPNNKSLERGEMVPWNLNSIRSNCPERASDECGRITSSNMNPTNYNNSTQIQSQNNSTESTKKESNMCQLYSNNHGNWWNLSQNFFQYCGMWYRVWNAADNPHGECTGGNVDPSGRDTANQMQMNCNVSQDSHSNTPCVMNKNEVPLHRSLGTSLRNRTAATSSPSPPRITEVPPKPAILFPRQCNYSETTENVQLYPTPIIKNPNSQSERISSGLPKSALAKSDEHNIKILNSFDEFFESSDCVCSAAIKEEINPSPGAIILFDKSQCYDPMVRSIPDYKDSDEFINKQRKNSKESYAQTNVTSDIQTFKKANFDITNEKPDKHINNSLIECEKTPRQRSISPSYKCHRKTTVKTQTIGTMTYEAIASELPTNNYNVQPENTTVCQTPQKHRKIRPSQWVKHPGEKTFKIKGQGGVKPDRKKDASIQTMPVSNNGVNSSGRYVSWPPPAFLPCGPYMSIDPRMLRPPPPNVWTELTNSNESGDQQMPRYDSEKHSLFGDCDISMTAGKKPTAKQSLDSAYQVEKSNNRIDDARQKMGRYRKCSIKFLKNILRISKKKSNPTAAVDIERTKMVGEAVQNNLNIDGENVTIELKRFLNRSGHTIKNDTIIGHENSM